MKCYRLTQKGFLETMSEINFNEFAKRAILALKELEHDLDDYSLSMEEWSHYLKEELDGEAEEEKDEESSLLRDAKYPSFENTIHLDPSTFSTYETLEKLWESKE